MVFFDCQLGLKEVNPLCLVILTYMHAYIRTLQYVHYNTIQYNIIRYNTVQYNIINIPVVPHKAVAEVSE